MPELYLLQKISQYDIRIWISCLKLPGALLGVLNSSKGSKDVFNLRGVTDPLAGDLLRVF